MNKCLEPKGFSQRCLVVNCRAYAVYHWRTSGRAPVHSLGGGGGGCNCFIPQGLGGSSGRTLKGTFQGFEIIQTE